MSISTNKNSPQDSMDEIDQRLKQNQKDLVNMENFLQAKRMELTELQKYLIQEFQNMQEWKEKQDRIRDIIDHRLKDVLEDVKNLMRNVVRDYRYTFESLMKQAGEIFHKKLQQKNRQIQLKNRQMTRYKNQIQKLKYQINKGNKVNFNLTSHPTGISNANDPRNLSRSSSLKKVLTNKSMSKSTLLEYQVSRVRTSKQKIQNSHSKSPHEDRNQRGLRNFKNYCQEQNKLHKSSTTKKISFEIQKTLKEDYENQKILIDHKKYVKQKIECLKNKNSGVVYDIKGDRTLKRY